VTPAMPPARRGNGNRYNVIWTGDVQRRGQGSSTRTQKIAEEILGGSNVPEPSVLTPLYYRKLHEAPGMDGGGTPLPAFSAEVQGQRPREPPELRSCDRSRNSLAKAAELEALGGAG
jgi:hypothetical protein